MPRNPNRAALSCLAGVRSPHGASGARTDINKVIPGRPVEHTEKKSLGICPTIQRSNRRPSAEEKGSEICRLSKPVAFSDIRIFSIFCHVHRPG